MKSDNLDLLGSNRFSPQTKEWKLIGHRVELLKNDPRFYADTVIHSEYHILIMMQRETSWYLWNVMLLEWMMVVLTVSSMVFPFEAAVSSEETFTTTALFSSANATNATVVPMPNANTTRELFSTVNTNTSSHMQVAITVLLALIMTQFGMKRHTPRVKEATFSEHYANLSVGTVIAFIFYTAIFEWLDAKTGHAAMSESVKASKMAFANLLVIVWLLGHVLLGIRLQRLFSERIVWKSKSLISIAPPILRPEL